MNNIKDILTLLPDVSNNFSGINNKNLTRVTAKLYSKDCQEFDNAIKAINHKIDISTIPKPAIAVSLSSLDGDLVKLYFISFNLAGDVCGAKLVPIEPAFEECPSFLWLNQETAVSTGVVYFTNSYFEAETVAQFGNASVIYCHELLDIAKVNAALSFKYPNIERSYVLGAKLSGEVDLTKASLELPYILPKADTFNKTLVQYGENEVLLNLSATPQEPHKLTPLQPEPTKTKKKRKLSDANRLLEDSTLDELRNDCETTIIINKKITALLSKNRNRLYAEIPGDDGLVGAGAQILTLSFYMWPIAFARMPDGSKTYIIETLTQRFSLPAEALGNGSLLRANLATHEIAVYLVSSKEFGLLQTILQVMCFSLTKEIQITHRNGWHSYKIAIDNDNYRTIEFYNISIERSVPAEIEIVYSFKHKRNKFSVVGTADNFYIKLLPLLKHNPTLWCSLLRTMAAPLIKMLGISPVMFNYFCPTRRGKSIMLAIGCAFAGITKDVDPLKSFESWAGSIQGIIAMMHDFSDSFLALDDLSTATPTTIKNLIYLLSNGEPGPKALQTGAQRDSMQFRCVIDSTAEGKIRDELQEHGIKLKGGVYSRCVDFALPSTEEMGIIQNLNGRDTPEIFFTELAEVLTTEFRGALWLKWLELVSKMYNDQQLLSSCKGSFKDFKNTCVASYKHLLKDSTQQSCILNNIYLLGFVIQLAIQYEFISDTDLGFSAHEFVGHLLSWYIGDEQQINTIGFAKEVEDKCREMIAYKTQNFTRITKSSDDVAYETSQPTKKHCGYLVSSQMLDQKMNDKFYFTRDEFNSFFNSTSKSKTTEIKNILKMHEAVELNEDGTMKRHRLPGNRSLGIIFYVVDPYKFLNYGVDNEQ